MGCPRRNSPADGLPNTGTRFTEITIHARLMLDEPGSDEKALWLFEKAEKTCLVTNSLAVPVTLDAEIASQHASGSVA